MNDLPRETQPTHKPPSLVDKVIRFCLENKLVVVLVVLFFVAWGAIVAPFDWHLWGFPRRPIPVDAIPDIGEKQQIVFTEWMGRSPQDVDDQITYPLTTYLLGVPGVKTVRSYSFFGFSTIYVIFEEWVDFYWARSRVLEKLQSIPPGILPEGVRPALGPDATPLGQIFQYTLEGCDPDGKPAGGWNLEQLRTVQDWTVRFALLSANGISEVASIGGYVKEYQVDVDPDAMRAHNVALEEVFAAVRTSNIDVGAMTIEVNRVDYMIRGLGFIKSVADVENSVVKVNNNVPIYVKNVARVTLGPAYRRGALDKEGAEVVGGIVVVRYGYNPLAAIKNLQEKIESIQPALPVRAVVDFSRTSPGAVEEFARGHGFEAFSAGELSQEGWTNWLRTTPRAEWPEWATTSQVTIVSFYDRTGLIYETLGTLNAALYEQVLITTIVVIIMAAQLRVAVLISAVMPLAVLGSFIAMKLFGVDANLVSLSGIAIAVGTIVDMGIIICQNILQHLEDARPEENRLEVIYRASSEVGSAVLTAVATTVVGFLPVFAMTGAEGKLFRPLAFTKTFCLIGSIVVALTVIPAAAHVVLTPKPIARTLRRLIAAGLSVSGLVLSLWLGWRWAGLVLALVGLYVGTADYVPAAARKWLPWIINGVAVIIVGVLLTTHWLPLGPEKGLWRNLIVVGAFIGGFQVFYYIVQRFYAPILRWCLAHKLLFLCMPAVVMIVGYTAWLGFGRVFSFVPAAAERIGIEQETVRQTPAWSYVMHEFPGFGKEFMPPLDEGSYLYMPTTMPHASIGEALDIVSKQDAALRAIPEVDSVVGKVGRAESALDPAPVGMVETVINYKPEYAVDKDGRRLRFKYDEETGQFALRDGEPVPDPKGRPYRQWRDHIRHPDDIWKEIVKAAEIPGTTSAPKLQPIAARIVMVQSGMRAPMGVKVKGPDLKTIERVGLDLERILKDVPSVEPSTVIADRVIGSPYLEIAIDRMAAARYGVSIRAVQDVIETAIGGGQVTTTVEGRSRYPVRVRYLRELRDNIESLGRILVPTMDGAQVPLAQLSEVRYVRGPEAVKSEDTFLVSYVLFDKKPGFAEVDVVEQCQRMLQQMEESGAFVRPPGVEITWAGTYENELHARRTLALVLPLSLFVIFMIIYFQFKSVTTTLLVFSTIFACWAGGLLLIWLYGQPWFLDFAIFGTNMRDLFQVHTVNMSVAIWVGFLALFGIASDDAVVICTYLDQRFAEVKPSTIAEVRQATVYAGKRRSKACLMTTATTVLALLPVLTSTGRGSDIMVPMSLPSFGGMVFEVITMLLAPVLYCTVKEIRLKAARRRS